MSTGSARPTDYARLIAVPAIWGGTFVGGKYVVAVLSPLMGSLARYVVACVALLVAAFALRLGASVASIFTNLVPLFGAAFGVLLLGEPLLASMLVGGAIAIVGVFMVSRP